MTGYSAPAAWRESFDNINMVDTGSLDKFDSFMVQSKHVYDTIEFYMHQYDRTLVAPGICFNLITIARDSGGNNFKPVYNGLIGIKPS